MKLALSDISFVIMQNSNVVCHYFLAYIPILFDLNLHPQHGILPSSAIYDIIIWRENVSAGSFIYGGYYVSHTKYLICDIYRGHSRISDND